MDLHQSQQTGFHSQSTFLYNIDACVFIVMEIKKKQKNTVMYIRVTEDKLS